MLVFLDIPTHSTLYSCLVDIHEENETLLSHKYVDNYTSFEIMNILPQANPLVTREQGDR